MTGHVPTMPHQADSKRRQQEEAALARQRLLEGVAHLVCSIAQAPEGGIEGASEAAAQGRVGHRGSRAQALAGRRLHQ